MCEASRGGVRSPDSVWTADCGLETASRGLMTKGRRDAIALLRSQRAGSHRRSVCNRPSRGAFIAAAPA